MTFEFKLPELGEGIQEAQVLAWKVSVGQDIAAFQPLCEVESAKAAVELTAPVAGRVRETRFAEGAIAHLGDVLVVIDTQTDGDGSPSPWAGQESATGNVPAGEAEWFGIVGSPPRAAEVSPTSQRRASERVRAAPFVRKLARDLEVRLEDVPGSGPQGRVRKVDIEARALVTQAPPPSAASAKPT